MRSISLVRTGPKTIQTEALRELPYLSEILSAWDIPIGESRISLLETGASVEEHVDVEFYWKHRLRIHIVVQSNPDATFGCDGHVLHLPEGQVWVSNNWAPHWIANRGITDRIHVVIDTVGSPLVWQWIADGWSSDQNIPCPSTDSLPLFVPFPSSQSIRLEQSTWGRVRTPSEVQEMVSDIIADATSTSLKIQHSLQCFVQDWRWLYHHYGDSQRQQYLTLVHRLLDDLPEIIMPNGVRTHQIISRQIGASLLISPIISELIVLVDMPQHEIHSIIHHMRQQTAHPIYIEHYDAIFEKDTEYKIIERLNQNLKSLDGEYWINLSLSNLRTPIVLLTTMTTEKIEYYPRVPTQIIHPSQQLQYNIPTS